MSFTCTLSQNIDVNDVISIAEQAAKVILEVYASKVRPTAQFLIIITFKSPLPATIQPLFSSPPLQTDDWDVQAKSDDSPLTRADKEANAVICDGLARIAAHIPIVSEENRAVSHTTRQGYLYSWCVDPLDGTKEFIKRNGQFTVNIALLEGSRPVMGVVQVPVSGKVYWAVKGKGAHVREGGVDRQICCAEFDPSDVGLTLVASASHLTKETEDFVAEYTDPKFKQLGSSLKLLLVAEGEAHVYPRLAPTCEWDTAASQAVVEEAGGVVLQAGSCDTKGKALEDWRAALAKGKPVEYNKQAPLNPFFVVYGRRRTAA
jgi:3'(2'), 5'-bisphosphate nucleotidase